MNKKTLSNILQLAVVVVYAVAIAIFLDGLNFFLAMTGFLVGYSLGFFDVIRSILDYFEDD